MCHKSVPWVVVSFFVGKCLMAGVMTLLLSLSLCPYLESAPLKWMDSHPDAPAGYDHVVVHQAQDPLLQNHVQQTHCHLTGNSPLHAH